MKRHQAIVIGGGIAGLATAQVLSKYFTKIILIDKDSKLGQTTARPGASQGNHLHVLLKRGQNILFKQFPNIKNELIKKNCPVVDWAENVIWEGKNGPFPRYKSGIETISMSRPLLESLMVNELKRNNNVEFKTERISKLSGNSVHFKNRILQADLIAVCTGANVQFGNMTQTEQSLDIHLLYQSVLFKGNSLKLPEGDQYYYQTDPSQNVPGGVICPIENGLAIATIIEYGAKPNSRKLEYADFIEKSKQIPGGRFFDIISEGIPISDISVFFKKNMYQRKFFSNNSVIYLGDYSCSLNPAFGQGMTCSLMAIEKLDRLLRLNLFTPMRFNNSYLKLIRKAYIMALFGSKKHGFSKWTLDLVLKAVQKFRGLHYIFLTQLHILPLREEK